MESEEEELGPIDVVVIGYPPGAPMTGGAVPIFLDLVDRGIIRVLDVRFVRKDGDGTFSGFDLAELDEDAAGDLTVFAGASTGLLDDDDVAVAAAETQQPAPAPAPAPAAPAPTAGRDPVAQLKDLADLKAEGVLTEEEFSAQKARILAG
jgi:Short C-terminal domain